MDKTLRRRKDDTKIVSWKDEDIDPQCERGTLGYVMSEVEDGKPFRPVVNAAKSLGYIEPGKCSSGTIIFSGLLLRKSSKRGSDNVVCIVHFHLPFCCFFGPSSSCSITLISVGNALLTAMEDVIQSVRLMTCFCRRMAMMIEHLQFVRLQVEIYSRCYEKQPLVIQGAGVGNDTTAAGVLADILDIQDLFP
ncbi:hypothetical protein KY284_008613 [Solanum tuberosum]|nr:hypothetical protein KY284_008613 [Solanum tuberosum]